MLLNESTNTGTCSGPEARLEGNRLWEPAPSVNEEGEYTEIANDQPQAAIELNATEEQPITHPVLQDHNYLAVLETMQQGRWGQATTLLHTLQARYPSVQTVEELLQEAAFRADIEINWTDKVKGRQGIGLPVRTLKPIVGGFILVVLLLVGVLYYGRTQRVNALFDQTEQLRQAEAALAVGQYREALDLFQQIITTNPTNAEARSGQSEALRQLQLATDYQNALDLIATHNDEQALALLTTLQSQAPGYRDVAKRLEEVKIKLGTRQRFTDAEFAFANGLWVTAITQYEELRRFSHQYETVTAEEHLAIAYLKAGQQLVAIYPNSTLALTQAQDYLQKAAQLDPGDVAINTEEQLLTTFRAGEQLVNQQQYEQGIKALYPIYETRPDYLGGYMADLLYHAYVGVAERSVEEMDWESARALYQRIIDLELDSKDLARQRIAELTLLLTPTPTPTAIVVYQAPAPVIVAPTPTVEVQPTVSWHEQYQGWIAFRSNRTGGESVYIMRADNSEIQPAPAAVIDGFLPLYQQQQQTADGSQRVYVQQVADQSGANIFKTTTDQPAEGGGQMLTNYIGTEYDPVWSLDGQSIAFVSNHTGNDEIWVMDGNGGQQRQLTFNEWQWDKHPSFSPNGQQLVFYSNRTGTRQIWIMNADGSGQRNLSNNGFDEWDPVWIR